MTNWAIWLAYVFIAYLSLPFIKKFVWPTTKKIIDNVLGMIKKNKGEKE